MVQYRTFPICTVGKNENVFIVFPEVAEERLSKTCFRGKEVEKAGNFSAWDSFYEMMTNALLRQALEQSVVDSVLEYLELKPTERHFDESIEVNLEFNVGWSSTEDIEKFADGEFEPFSINARVTGLQALTDSKVLAPRTPYVTIVYRLFHNTEDLDWAAVIYSVYPGKDVGPLQEEEGISDISVREGIVFFDWEHAGASYK